MFSNNSGLIDKHFLKAGNTYFCKKDCVINDGYHIKLQSWFYNGKSYFCQFDGILMNETGGFFIEQNNNAREYFE